MTLIQRFGSAANLDVHLHCLVLDGVYRSGADDNETHTLRPLQAAAVTYRSAFGPSTGRKVLALQGAMPSEGTTRQPLWSDIDVEIDQADCHPLGVRLAGSCTLDLLRLRDARLDVLERGIAVTLGKPLAGFLRCVRKRLDNVRVDGVGSSESSCARRSPPLPRLAGVTSARCLPFGANTPWKGVRLTRGGRQGCPPGDEIERLEDDAGRAVAVSRLQRVADASVRSERQALLRHRRAADVAAQPFELLAFIHARRHAGVQGDGFNSPKQDDPSSH